MKVLPFKIPKTEGESFRVQEDDVKHFYDVLHMHPEIQITYIKSGEGTRFLGDVMDTFQTGDIYIIGSNVPHVFRNDECYYDDRIVTENAHSISVYFKIDAFGNDFFQIPEMTLVRDMLELSSRCLKLGEGVTEQIVPLFNRIRREAIDYRFLSLLELLTKVAHSQDFYAISDTPNLTYHGEKEGKRMNDVLQFLNKNYHRVITLEEIADVANMSPTAFCRFFKMRTRKTYISFLNDYRLGVACKMLREPDVSVSEVATKTGFNNISNFNRQFRKYTGVTPSSYRKQMYAHINSALSL